MIAVVGLISVFNFRNSQMKSRDQRRISDVRTLAEGIDKYFADYGEYPPVEMGKIVGCGSPGFSNACDWGLGDFRDTDGTVYADKVPTDPQPLRSQYLYITNGDRSTYLLLGALEAKSGEFVVSGIPYSCGSVTCNFGVESGEFGHKVITKWQD